MERHYRCAFDAPLRFWYQRPDGLWASRQWELEELKKYRKEVLGQ